MGCPAHIPGVAGSSPSCPPQVCTEQVPDLNSPPRCLVLGHQETSRGKYRNHSPFIILPDTESEDEAA